MAFFLIHQDWEGVSGESAWQWGDSCDASKVQQQPKLLSTLLATNVKHSTIGAVMKKDNPITIRPSRDLSQNQI